MLLFNGRKPDNAYYISAGCSQRRKDEFFRCLTPSASSLKENLHFYVLLIAFTIFY
jgi:hypothetical protein